MLQRLSIILANGLLTAITCCFAGCASAPATRAEARGSAAFALDASNEPWLKDAIHTVGPRYSHADRAAWRQGRGVFHLVLDFKTGSVRSVTVKQTTRHTTLDEAAVIALKQWQFRPGSWRELDIPVSFEMAKTKGDYIRKVRESEQLSRAL